jgi:Cu+-exporting ATPase
MKVNPEAPKGGTWAHEGHTYFFCSPKCREKFRAEPQKYLAPQQAEPPAGPPGTVYVCTMDPEVRQDHPGACPKCGMALEPEAPVVATKTQYVCPMHPEVVREAPGNCPKCGMALEPKALAPGTEEDNAERRDMEQRFWVAAALTLPVFLIAMAHLVPGTPAWVESDPSRWVQFVFSAPVVFWAGWPFLQRGGRSILNRHLNMFTLIALGVGVAWFYSAAVMLAPGLFPPSFRHHGKIGIYFESAAVITVLVARPQPHG